MIKTGRIRKVIKTSTFPLANPLSFGLKNIKIINPIVMTIRVIIININT